MPKLPSVSGERAGFIELRQRGSHVSLEKRVDEKLFRTVVPLHSSLSKGTLSDILKQSGLSVEEFIELL